MKNVTISKIEPTNPVISSYIDKINEWDKEGIVQLKRENHIIPFYALYYNTKFLAAGTIEFDKEKSKAKVAMVNGSYFDYEYIQNAAINNFQNLVEKEFGTNDIEFRYVKKRG